jgi:hypothetical protein
VADIFISWGSPDRAAVGPLRDKLREQGLDVWEYSEDMGAGDQIQFRVMKTIEQTRIALLCLSDEALKREWVRNEVAVSAYAKETRQVEHIIPVKVGALADENFPLALRNLGLFLLDLSDPARMNENLERLINDIKGLLAEAAPLVMPAAIFAMNKSESMGLFAGLRRAYDKAKAKQRAAEAGGATPDESAPPPTPSAAGAEGDDEGAVEEDSAFTEEQEELWKLCKLVGMEDPPDLYEFLQERYGSTPEEMTPFQSNRKIIDVINDILLEVNNARLEVGHRPIYLRWVTEKLSEGTREERRAVREWWRSRDSLLIIDSVSTFHQTIKQRLVSVPAQRSAILWLPPYTQHTAGMEQALRNAAEAIPALGDEFNDLGAGTNPKRSVSFDTSTSLALQVWLRRALLQVSDEASALERNVKSISFRKPAPSRIGTTIFGPTGAKGGPQ